MVEISLPMPVRRVFANENIKADIGRVAVERGPLVYCVEWSDNNGTTSNLVLDDKSVLTAEARPDLLNGITVITGEGLAYRYKGGKVIGEKQKIMLIPYYAWAHRGRGEMDVWLGRVKSMARPIPEPTLASTAKVSSSPGGKGVEAIHDLYEPENSNDHGRGYLHWWPKKGTTEWVEYDFGKPVALSETSVYWFDDTGQGECRVPASWKALVQAGGKWVPVKNLNPYGLEKDKYNTVKFAPVRASALRLEIQLPENFSAGIQEWKVR
jgi:hypothetical protein